MRRLPGEARLGGSQRGEDGTRLNKDQKILPLGFFRSAQRFGKEDLEASVIHFCQPQTVPLWGLRSFPATQAAWKEHPQPFVPGLLDRAAS